jgi:hypothetical protein
MAKVDFRKTVTIEQLAKLIPTISATVEGEDSHVTPIILSEPGCGKTSILKLMEKKLGNKYDYIYVDCPSKDILDIAASIPDHSSKSLEQYVGSLFKNNGKPMVIMLDEVFKVPKLMGVLWTRLMLERTAGDMPLPLGSIVFGTSNNGSDGVGDFMQSHQGNRVCFYHMEKPNAKSYNLWAGENGISSIIRSFVAMNPRVMNSYLDGGQEDNPFIFNPNKPSQSLSFISPRSLAKCNRIIVNKDNYSRAEIEATLAGTIGTAGAEQLCTFIDMHSQVLMTSEIIANPEGVTVPTDVAALCMVMFNGVDDIKTQDDLSAFMRFVTRIKHTEIQNIFFTMLMGTMRTVSLAKGNAEISAWCKDNYKLL